jgi:hypothetical protein
VALALVGGVVDGHDEPLSTLPGKNQEAIVGPVAFPGGDASEQLPSAVTHRRLLISAAFNLDRALSGRAD